jgi:Family of unknown function (DUF5681)
MSEDKVGYGNPPKHTRFRAGQSGNPKGRRKGVRNFMTDVRQTLMMPVRVNNGGRARNVTTQKGALMLLREKALKGDKRALDLLLSLGVRFNNEMPEFGADQELSIDDRTILDAFRAEVAANLETSAPAVTAQTRVRLKVKRGRKGNK